MTVLSPGLARLPLGQLLAAPELVKIAENDLSKARCLLAPIFNLKSFLYRHGKRIFYDHFIPKYSDDILLFFLF
jgi:hypothetical protein